MRILEYDRQAAFEYAKKWAFRRNPRYYNFEKIGGDRTNFASQCIYAGAKNYELYAHFRLVLHKHK